ncbi:MAG: M20/M25/M40 family metallo-hydrolase [Candidatus Dormibacteraceae bacterium]
MAAPVTPSPATLLQELIRFDTTNPPGDEGPCLDHLRRQFAVRGIEGTILAGDPSRPNLVVRLPGRGEAPPLLLQGHVDVVPTGGQDWAHPPFGGDLLDGVVWGRGALDMKGGVAMMATAALRALDGGREPAGDLVLAFLSDEEAGGVQGAKFLAEQHPEQFAGVRHCLGEGGGIRQEIGGVVAYPIMAAEKRVVRVRITLHGPGGHGSRVHRGGTMAELGRVLTALDEARLPLHLDPIVERLIRTFADRAEPALAGRLRDLLDPATAEVAIDGLGHPAAYFDPILHNTANVTFVDAGTKDNVIPALAALRLDVRVLPASSTEEVVGEIRHVIGEGPEIEVTLDDPAGREPELDACFDLLGAVLEELDPGAVAVPTMLAGGTDARHFARLGIQGYGYLPLNLPPGFPRDTIHAADERVPASALEFGTRALSAVFDRYRG